MELLAQLPTGILGDVATPTQDALVDMQHSPYILRARNGRLTQLAVEKAVLPHDPRGHVQQTSLAQAADGTLYVAHGDGACLSADGGRTWTLRPFTTPRNCHWKPLHDGTLIAVSMDTGEGATGPVTVWASRDTGQHWSPLSKFPVEWPGGYRLRYAHWGLHRLPDNTLVYGMDLRGCRPLDDLALYPDGVWVLVHYQSRDGGVTWDGPYQVSSWATEGGLTVLPSGRWLAAVRYQGRPDLPSDPVDLRARLATSSTGTLFKHVFLTDSDDNGHTWRHLRQLCTVFGQCYGYPVSLSDGTVVVAHDTRYGPGEPGGRAMISRDMGQTWENEAYYLYYGLAQSGFNQSVALNDGTLLTVAGASDRLDGNAGSWDNWTGHSTLTAIRWKPER